MGTGLSPSEEKKKAKQLCIDIVNENYEKLLEIGFLNDKHLRCRDGRKSESYDKDLKSLLFDRLKQMNPHSGSAYELDLERNNLGKKCKLSTADNMVVNFYSFDVYYGEHINANITITNDARILGSITNKDGETIDQFNGSLNNGNPFYEYADRKCHGEWSSYYFGPRNPQSSEEKEYYFKKLCGHIDYDEKNPSNYLLDRFENVYININEPWLVENFLDGKKSMAELYKEVFNSAPVTLYDVEKLVNDQSSLLEVEKDIDRNFGRFRVFSYLSNIKEETLVPSVSEMCEIITNTADFNYLYDKENDTIYIEEDDELHVVYFLCKDARMSKYKKGEEIPLFGETYEVGDGLLQTLYMQHYDWNENLKFNIKNSMPIEEEPEPEIKKTRTMKPGR